MDFSLKIRSLERMRGLKDGDVGPFCRKGVPGDNSVSILVGNIGQSWGH